MYAARHWYLFGDREHKITYNEQKITIDAQREARNFPGAQIYVHAHMYGVPCVDGCKVYTADKLN